MAKYCGLVKRQTGHAFLNAQWVCLLMKFTKQHLFVIKVAGVMKSLFVYLLLNSSPFGEIFELPPCNCTIDDNAMAKVPEFK